MVFGGVARSGFLVGYLTLLGSLAMAVVTGCGGESSTHDNGGASSMGGGAGATTGGTAGKPAVGGSGTGGLASGGSAGTGGAAGTGGSAGTSGPDMPNQSHVPSCFEPMDAGACTEFTTRYYWDVSTNKCQPFQYGGCEGNDNNFTSFKGCADYCWENVSCSCAANTPVERNIASIAARIARRIRA